MIEKGFEFLWRVLKIIDDILNFIELFFIYLSLFVMVFLSFFHVVSRNLFSFGFVWADDLLRHLVLWSGFIGAAVATREGRHINIDVFTRLLGGGQKRIFNLIVNVFSSIICALFFLASLNLIKVEREFPDTLASLKIPVWIVEMVFPIVFALMTFRFFFKGLREIYPHRGRN